MVRLQKHTDRLGGVDMTKTFRLNGWGQTFGIWTERYGDGGTERQEEDGGEG